MKSNKNKFDGVIKTEDSLIVTKLCSLGAENGMIKITLYENAEELKAEQDNFERAREFLSCLGNGKSIYQCESENYWIDEMEEKSE